MRFAPSPNGFLHLGHAYSALLNNFSAKKLNGEFILRIEDIDITRARQIYIEAIYQDLRWLGLNWSEPVFLQSKRFEKYKKAANRLKNIGLLYPCFCTRKEIKQNSSNLDPDGAPLYNEKCKNLSADIIKQKLAQNIPHQWRLNMQKSIELAGDLYFSFSKNENFEHIETKKIDPLIWGDVVLVRKDFPTSYHLSVVIDDDEQKITHIVRGKDLLKASYIHILLQKLLALNSQIYFHHDLILDEERKKLAKSRGAKSLRDLRNGGISAKHICKMLGFG